MFSWFVKAYLLIRGDRFSRDKLEEIRDKIHELTLDVNDRIDHLCNHLAKIEANQKAHVAISETNLELLEQKINNNHVANEMMIKMINDRFDALNLKIEVLTR